MIWVYLDQVCKPWCLLPLGIFGVIAFFRWMLKPEQYPKSDLTGWEGGTTEPEIQLALDEYHKQKREALKGKPDPRSSYEKYEGQWVTKGYADRARKSKQYMDEGYRDAADKVRQAAQKFKEYEQKKAEYNKRHGINPWGDRYVDGQEQEPKTPPKLPSGKK